MHELYQAIEDPEAVLALEPEELGATLLFLLRDRVTRQDSRELIHPQNLIGQVGYRDASRGISGYPLDKVAAVRRAVAEAFAWLTAQGLLIPATDSNASAGWMILSRRAERFESRSEFMSYASARRLPRELLHPTLKQGVWLSFVRGEFADAVFKAMRTVEIAVREAAGFSPGEHGVPMIRRAFHKGNGPLRDPEQEEPEREALMHLFAGALGSYKNSHSHRHVSMENAEEAIEIVMLASHLLRIVDARRDQARQLVASWPPNACEMPGAHLGSQKKVGA